MGCDIHAYIETKRKEDASNSDRGWDFLGTFRFSRNYTLFALMAGVHRYAMYPDPKTLEAALLKRGVSRLDDTKLSKIESELIMLEGCDSGITRGQPSFAERGIPKNISWNVVNEYTMYVVENGDGEEDNVCKRSQADGWVASGSSEAWDIDANGAVTRVTNPDWHSGSWLDADEVRTLALRFHETLVASIPDVKKLQEQSITWVKNGLKKAIATGDVEGIAFSKQDLERESSWDTYDPLREHAYICTEALATMMDALEARGLNARLVFWFDN